MELERGSLADYSPLEAALVQVPNEFSGVLVPYPTPGTSRLVNKFGNPLEPTIQQERMGSPSERCLYMKELTWLRTIPQQSKEVTDAESEGYLLLRLFKLRCTTSAMITFPYPRNRRPFDKQPLPQGRFSGTYPCIQPEQSFLANCFWNGAESSRTSHQAQNPLGL